MKHAVSLERKGKGWQSRRWLTGVGALVLLLWLMTPAQAAASNAGTAVLVQSGLSSALVGLPAGQGKVQVSEKPAARSPFKPPTFAAGPPPWAPGKPTWAPGSPPWAGKSKTQALGVRGGSKKGK